MNLRFHDKISGIIQYLYGIIIQFAKYFEQLRLPSSRCRHGARKKLMIWQYLDWGQAQMGTVACQIKT